VLQGGIFINYRGEDSYSYGALLHAELSRRFGSSLVFLDSESIPAGADYVEQLLDRVRQARVVLVVIGTRWLAAAGPAGRRIDDPADWIRRELVEAFAYGLRVIPVLTDGADMPTEEDLPDQLAALARCQYRQLRHRDASADLARLATDLADLDPGLGAAAAVRASPPPGWLTPPSHTPGWPALWPPPDQVPQVTGYFTGRHDELAQLTRVRDPANNPMVSTVTGMPGVGKTALVVRAARQLIDAGRFPEGAVFVDLCGFSNREPVDPAAALDMLLHSLGVPSTSIPADLDGRSALCRTVVARRRLLIVLDNALDETQVRPLLPGTGPSLVLITSRRRLAGLDDAEHLSVDVLPAPEAAHLFQAMVDTRPSSDQAIEQIVRLCGQLPLAIRIAGARLRISRALRTDHLLAHLRAEKDRLGVLDDGERSITATLAVSYRHLSTDEQHALAALGLHPGLDFEPSATAALLKTTPQQALRILDGLDQVNLLDQPVADRYTLHDLVRAYAATLDTGTEPEQQVALGRLYDHYAHTATRAVNLVHPYDGKPHPPQHADTATVADPPHRRRQTRGQHFADAAAAHRWLATEMHNLIAAAHHAATHGRPDHTIQQSALLHRHMRSLGRYTDALALHQHALTLARTTGDTGSELHALIALGFIYRTTGGPAIEHLRDAINKARTVGDRTSQTHATTVLGQVYFIQGENSQAARAFHRALKLANVTHDALATVEALAGLGRIHYIQGRLKAADDSFKRALTTAQRLHYLPGEIDALIGLGYVTCAQGHYASAAIQFEHVQALANTASHLTGELNALVGLGNTHRMQHHYDTAAHYYNRVLDISRSIGDRNGELGALSGLANSLRLQGHHQLAQQHFQQMLQIATTLRGRNYQLDAHLGLGRTHQTLGNPEQALHAHHQALNLAQELGQQPDQVRALDGLAHAHHTLGHYDHARKLWQHALHILNNLDTTTTEDVTAHDIQTALSTTPAQPNTTDNLEPHTEPPQ
jgi:tetratricopeptide (TPR) repeat protein